VQAPPLEIDHVLARALALGVAQPAARGDSARQFGPPGTVPAPVQAGAEAMPPPPGQRRAPTPEGADVVGELVAGRQLDQMHCARPPAVQRLHPGTGASLVPRLGILEVGEVALALHQAEAARVIVLETAVRDLRRVAQRAPDLLAAAGQ